VNGRRYMTACTRWGRENRLEKRSGYIERTGSDITSPILAFASLVFVA